jgi:hypothetical protein
MREKIITADFYRARFNGSMNRIRACPIGAQVTQVPLFLDEPVSLLLGHLVVYELGHN